MYPVIFGACNPMIDVTARVDAEFLKKYNLKENDAIIGDESNYSIYEEIKSKYSDDLQYTTGGSGLNTLKTISWILGKGSNATLFMGCVGPDEYGKMIKLKTKELGVRTLLEVTSQAPTATCAILLTNNDRSMVAHLGAALHASFKFLEENWHIIKNIQVYYITGYFFIVCWEAVMKLARYSFKENRLMALNLSACFIADLCADKFLTVLPYVDIIFGNEEEAVHFSKVVFKHETNDIRKICELITSYKKLAAKRRRIVVITRAEKSVIYTDGYAIREMNVPCIDSSTIIDTSSAGDAFVGGFLAQLIQNKSLEKCIDCGIWISGLMIQRHGCTFPEIMDYI